MKILIRGPGAYTYHNFDFTVIFFRFSLQFFTSCRSAASYVNMLTKSDRESFQKWILFVTFWCLFSVQYVGEGQAPTSSPDATCLSWKWDCINPLNLPSNHKQMHHLNHSTWLLFKSGSSRTNKDRHIPISKIWSPHLHPQDSSDQAIYMTSLYFF